MIFNVLPYIPVFCYLEYLPLYRLRIIDDLIILVNLIGYPVLLFIKLSLITYELVFFPLFSFSHLFLQVFLINRFALL